MLVQACTNAKKRHFSYVDGDSDIEFMPLDPLDT